jgi:perosamine synthetase
VLGIVQLSRIDEIKAKRRQVAKWYQQMLADDDRLIVPCEPKGCDVSWFVFVVRLTEKYALAQRDRILEAMRGQGIEVKNYFPPVLLQPFIAEQFDCRPADFPVTESVSERTIALPFYNNLTKDDVALVCKILKQVLD